MNVHQMYIESWATGMHAVNAGERTRRWIYVDFLNKKRRGRGQWIVSGGEKMQENKKE